MLYKFGPMGYFGRVSQISRGPWFAELMVEDDGLEYYYMHQDNQGNVRHLLSNNMTFQDRTAMQKLFYAQSRVTGLAWGFGLFMGASAITQVPQLKRMAYGWKGLALLGVGLATKCAISSYVAKSYGPIIGAYFRKYQDVGAVDAFELRDRKREYYLIDDSQYMSDEAADTENIHKHANHGPQPDGQAKDASYIKELDAFLDGKDNGLKEHTRFLNYEYNFKDKSYPTLDQASSLIEGVSKQ